MDTYNMHADGSVRLRLSQTNGTEEDLATVLHIPYLGFALDTQCQPQFSEESSSNSSDDTFVF